MCEQHEALAELDLNALLAANERDGQADFGCAEAVAPHEPNVSTELVEPDAAATRTAPRAICGWCKNPLAVPVPTQHVACPHCGHRLIVPAQVAGLCGRCQRIQAVPLGEIPDGAQCGFCGGPLIVEDFPLVPRRRVEALHRGHRHRASHHSDAAWAVFVVGLTVLVIVSSLVLF